MKDSQFKEQFPLLARIMEKHEEEENETCQLCDNEVEHYGSICGYCRSRIDDNFED